MKSTTMDIDRLLANAQAAVAPPPRKIWEIRTEEQHYAMLRDKTVADANRYGQKIDLIELAGGKHPVGRSMYINENPAVGSNPNRNKQHGFFFTADNCIGCHACEAACSEKNDNPAHLAFRSVGYVEGGSFPDYKRMNISMACNHCDDPVCLKGCPTRAYTKHTEYGAVLQDPETCFGCGYCTWVCPYNAPQLDPVKGQVSKCNMCVDRLEVGLKPACVAACVGNALDFGVIENIPEGREQARVEIPGFPSPDITRPNIRFQQIKQLPDQVTRTDSMPVKYHKDDQGRYRPAVDQKNGREQHWNLARLSSRENPLVMFTLAAQAAAGAFALQYVGAQAGLAGFTAFAASAMYLPLAILEFALVAFGLFMFLVGAVIQFGLILWTTNTVTEIAHDAARWAATQSVSPCDSAASRTSVAGAAGDVARRLALMGYTPGQWPTATALNAMGAEGVGVEWPVLRHLKLLVPPDVSVWTGVHQVLAALGALLVDQHDAVLALRDRAVALGDARRIVAVIAHGRNIRDVDHRHLPALLLQDVDPLVAVLWHRLGVARPVVADIFVHGRQRAELAVRALGDVDDHVPFFHWLLLGLLIP